MIRFYKQINRTFYFYLLEIWKNLSSDEKKDYKTPRVPKRKRENDEVKSTSNKLARFAAPNLS